MKFSLILAIDNNNNISQTLKSLKEQSIKNFNLLIISNHFREDIQNMVFLCQKYFETEYIVASNAKNLAELKNIALLHIKTDYVAFLTSDTVYNTNTLEIALNFLYENEKKVYVLNTDTIEKQNIDKSLNKRNMVELIKQDNYFINFKNSDIPFFNQKYSTCAMDIEYISRLLKTGYSANFKSSHKIISKKTNKLEENEVNSLIKAEIIKNKNIGLIILAIKNILKGEK